jgi:cytochrome b561
MQLRNSAQGYGAIPKSVHWFTVALVVVAWFLGTFGDDLPRGTARDVGMFLHVTAGLLIIALLVVLFFGDSSMRHRPPKPHRSAG